MRHMNWTIWVGLTSVGVIIWLAWYLSPFHRLRRSAFPKATRGYSERLPMDLYIPVLIRGVRPFEDMVAASQDGRALLLANGCRTVLLRLIRRFGTDAVVRAVRLAGRESPEILAIGIPRIEGQIVGPEELVNATTDLAGIARSGTPLAQLDYVANLVDRLGIRPLSSLVQAYGAKAPVILAGLAQFSDQIQSAERLNAYAEGLARHAEWVMVDGVTAVASSIRNENELGAYCSHLATLVNAIGQSTARTVFRYALAGVSPLPPENILNREWLISRLHSALQMLRMPTVEKVHHETMTYEGYWDHSYVGAGSGSVWVPDETVPAHDEIVAHDPDRYAREWIAEAANKLGSTDASCFGSA